MKKIKLGKREIYVHYGEGMGTIKARHPRREKPAPRAT